MPEKYDFIAIGDVAIDGAGTLIGTLMEYHLINRESASVR